MDRLARLMKMERKQATVCMSAAALAVVMLGVGIWFLVSKDFLYGGVTCACAVLVGFCAALYRAKCLMDEELRSYDERGRELSRMPCAWDWNGAVGAGELVFFKKGVACEADGGEAVPFVAFSSMSHCGLDGDGAMAVLEDGKGVLVLGEGNPAKAKGILARLESAGVAVKAM